MDQHDKKMFALGYKYKLVPTSKSFLPLYAKLLVDVSTLLKVYKDDTFEIVHMRPSVNTEVNLWEGITAAASNRKAFDEDRPLKALGPKVTTADLENLSKSARTNGQELSVEASEEGWIIKVFSCYDTDNKISILIPKESTASPFIF